MKQKDLKKVAGKMLVAGFDGIHVSAQIRTLIHDYHIAGVILFSRNIGTITEVRQLTTNLQKEAKAAGYEHPLLICIDQENGIVRRIEDGLTLLPGAMAIGATRNREYAYDIGKATAEELKALGINWNLAPVVDVNSNPDNPVIGVRSFGDNPKIVAQFGKAQMSGMQEGGVAAALKHFPGHGNTATDSHLSVAVIPHSMKHLEEGELIPYRACFKQNAASVLVSHIHFPVLESKEIPATISRKVITDLLRGKLGFEGVVTTDCMEMDAIKETISTPEGSLRAIQAGADITLVSHTYALQLHSLEKIMNAIETGIISEDEIYEKHARISRMTKRFTDWESALSSPSVSGSLKLSAHKALARKVYRHSVTIVHDHQSLPVDSSARILVLDPAYRNYSNVEDRVNEKTALARSIQVYSASADVLPINLTDESQVEKFARKAVEYDCVILGSINLEPGSLYESLMKKMKELKIKIICIAMCNPYDVLYLSGADALIATYEPGETALELAAGAVFGKEQVYGKLPVINEDK